MEESAKEILPIVDERIGQFLSSTPPVVEQILLHLGAKDLNRCSSVCKLWKQIADVEKRKRQDILWMFQVTQYPCADLMEICGSGKEDEHVTLDTIYTSGADDPWEVGNHFYGTIDESQIQPQSGIIFCSSKILEKPQRYFCAFEPFDEDEEEDEEQQSAPPPNFFYHEPLMQHLAKELPITCPVLCVGAPGIVGTPVDNSTPAEVEQFRGISGFMVPNIPGVKIQPFSIPEEPKRSKKRRKLDEEEIERLTGVPGHVPVKALLMFCEEVPDRGGVARAVIQHYLSKEDEKVALGGAIVDVVTAPMASKEEWPMAAGIIFTGENLNASSFIVEPTVRKAEELEAKLVEFKNGSCLSSNSVAFMFACCGRGCNYYGESNVEAKTFRKIFPTTLLFGCFSNGEIGHTYLPKESKKVISEEKKPKKTGNWVHGYTTIFVLLSW